MALRFSLGKSVLQGDLPTIRPTTVLRTAPFIFNLFAEGFHWILQSYLNWEFLAHYLDDFINVIPHDLARQAAAKAVTSGSISLVDMQSLGVPLLLFTSRTTRLDLHATDLDFHRLIPWLIQIRQATHTIRGSGRPRVVEAAPSGLQRSALLRDGHPRDD
jgi:hypothetical protein